VIDHISLGVSDLTRATAFYDAILSPLGYARLSSTTRGVGYGNPGERDEPLALHAVGDGARAPGPGCHLALTAPSRNAVEAFHVAAMSMGGTDDGGPGLRPQYGPGYYAAFMRDLDGHKLEAVCHQA